MTLAGEAGEAPDVADSRLTADSTFGDDEFRTCFEAAGHALRVETPLVRGEQLVVRIGVEHDPAAAADPARRAALAACVAELERRRPGASRVRNVDDPQFASCLDAAIGASGGERLPSEVEACDRAAAERFPTADLDFRHGHPTTQACLAKIGWKVERIQRGDDARGWSFSRL